MNIRKRIIKNFKGIKNDELVSIINNSITDNNNLTLPGIGVLFELLWINSDENSKNFIINSIINQLNQKKG